MVHENGARDYVSGAQSGARDYGSGAREVHEINFSRLAWVLLGKLLVDWEWDLHGKLSRLGMETPGQT